MRTSKLVFAALGVAALAGCVSLHPTLAPTAQPTATAGYVAAFLARSKGSGFGLGLLDTDTGAQYVIPFHDTVREGPLDLDARPVMIEVPPGNYRLASWMTYATLTHERTSRKEIPIEHALGRMFSLAAGEIVVLGSLEATTVVGFGRIDWKVTPRYMADTSAIAAVKAAYPGFAAAPATCLACQPPPARTRFDAAPRPAKLELTPPTTLQPPKRGR